MPPPGTCPHQITVHTCRTAFTPSRDRIWAALCHTPTPLDARMHLSLSLSANSPREPRSSAHYSRCPLIRQVPPYKSPARHSARHPSTRPPQRGRGGRGHSQHGWGRRVGKRSFTAGPSQQVLHGGWGQGPPPEGGGSLAPVPWPPLSSASAPRPVASRRVQPGPAQSRRVASRRVASRRVTSRRVKSRHVASSRRWRSWRR